MAMMEYYPGVTARLMAKDLTHTDQGSVTSGATVTIELYLPDGTLSSSQAGATGGTGDDWYADFTVPATLGEYTVKITATKSGATWKGKVTIRVKAF